jgi:hypothetical protein
MKKFRSLEFGDILIAMLVTLSEMNRLDTAALAELSAMTTFARPRLIVSVMHVEDGSGKLTYQRCGYGTE